MKGESSAGSGFAENSKVSPKTCKWFARADPVSKLPCVSLYIERFL